MARTLFLALPFVLSLVLSAAASGAPVINAASLGYGSGGIILTATGNAFGPTGPSILLYDDFTGTAGSSVPLNGASIGSWSGYPPSGGPKYSAIAHSPPTSMMVADGVTSHFQIIKEFPDPVSEIFVSYWVKVPEGTYFPAATAPKTFSNGSSWKLAWVFLGAYGYTGENDMMIPAYTGQGIIQLGSNDYTPDVVLGTGSWSWTNWMRFSIWMKANESDPTSNGVFFWQMLNETAGLSQSMITTKPVFDADSISNSLKAWDRITIPGWIAAPYDNVMPLYDDVYIAAGAGAAARAEIGDAPTYAACKRLFLATVESWSENEITGTVRTESYLLPDKMMYVYVTDADGQTNTDGYPIAGDGGGDSGGSGCYLETIDSLQRVSPSR